MNIGLLVTMTKHQAHRGPDGEGYVLLALSEKEKPIAVSGTLTTSVRSVPLDYKIGLGHRRLAIVDLTPLGHQPMGTEDGRLWITYNGEVYNAPELRRELVGLGHQFRSSTDTEVVLESYRRWGRACLDRFNGMFAFALWDAKEHTLFCARDRFGIKPFYYRFHQGKFLFASEIKALLCDPSYRKAPNDQAVYDYLSLARQDHTSETFFVGINQLQPGEFLTVREGSGEHRLRISRERWWRLSEETESMDRKDAAVRMRELLEASVRLELRADVPVGSCLSGGLDSSSIVCLMQSLLAANGGAPALQTFSSCHDDTRFDERPYIHSVLARTGASGREVFPNPDGLFQSLSDIIWHQEEPFAGTSVLAQWEVMRAVRSAGVKVVLDGQGADELLCGYPGFMGSRLADLIRCGHWGVGMREWRAWTRIHGGLQLPSLANLVRGILPGRTERWMRERITGERAWLAPTFVRNVSYESVMQKRQSQSVIDQHIARAVTQDLPALLHYEDRNSMAFSVEARVPFLDHRLVEWLVTVPPDLKIHQGMTKVLLRDAMVGVLPDDVRLRKDKMGFVTPEDQWLRVAWRPYIEGLLDSDPMRSRPYWQTPVLKEWYRRYRDGHVPIGPTVWRWVNLELWLQRYCD